MPKKQWINRKTATHFTLVHRPQNDPLIHDEDAPSMVLNPTNAGDSFPTGKQLGDLVTELGSDALRIRENEGEAANHGVYFDDTEYDYMQHLRDLGEGGGEATFIEAASPLNTGKGKHKESLEDALRKMDLREDSRSTSDDGILAPKKFPKMTYQSQQDVPDAIAGFQPDMDPRLREVLEALDDDAYVDDDDDDVFQALAKDAEELKPHEFEQDYPDYDDEGWESDDTAKPSKEYTHDAPRQRKTDEQPYEGPSQDWMEDFKKFQKEKGTEKKAPALAPSELQSSLMTTTTQAGRRKKRPGALTNPSTYSMTSSSLYRTEHMSILDARFEKLDEEYNADYDDMASVSAVSTASVVQGPMPSSLDGMLDDFLGTHSMSGKKRVRRGKWKNGTAELDEIRKELGPAIIPREYRPKVN